MTYYVSPKPYQYKKQSNRRPEIDRAGIVGQSLAIGRDEQELTGWVNGLEASDIEERFARALRRQQKKFAFQVPVEIPGQPWEKVVDFFVNDTLWYPVEVYGQIGHDSEEERQKDAVREALLNYEFTKTGTQPLKIVWWWELDTQDMANLRVQELFF